MLENTPFVHLHNHSCYSFLDASSKITALVQKAKDFNMPALALTDHGNMYGTIEFYDECNKAGINPIIGCEVYVGPGSRFEKSNSKRYHLVLLANSNEGYHNLIKIVSLANLEGFYYKSRADWDLITEHSKGVIGLSACVAGEIPQLILKKDIQGAEKLACKANEIFDSFYLELQDHGLQEQKIINKELIRISKKYNIPVVATNDSHYILQQDSQTQEVLLCIGTKSNMSDTDRFKFPNDQFYFKSPQEMYQLFAEIPEALTNTIKIADQCNLKIKNEGYYLPDFPGGTPQQLREMAYHGLIRRYTSPTPDIMDRFNYELEVITSMGFVNYFLIVDNIVNWAKNQGIPVGPGRGSAAGSLIAYCLGITELDPLKYGLLFERFLNPDRISMPDIDMDYCIERRGEVIKHIADFFGNDKVAQIVTFGTMAAKGAIRDAGRVLGYPNAEIDRMAKRIKNSLDDIGDDNHPVVKIARQIENIPRQTGLHAAGVIIAPEPLINLIPVQKVQEEDHNNETLCTQYEMHTCEDLGLLKMDILGLKTLTIIADAVKMLADRGIKIDINSIPLDDQKVYETFSKGETIAIFQFESQGMQRVLTKMKPDQFEDLIAAVALYRPGPIKSGMIDDYIDCKHGKKEIKYLHPVLEPILKETYGVILYQEQTMKIATEMAGFTLGEADLMRRAIGKKLPEILAAQRIDFVKGANANGIPEKIAEEVFNLIDYFSGYGFNKSHSAAYALISYQTAYLKTHYPVEFLAACLSNANDQNKAYVFLKECKRLNIPILPPEVNLSKKKFSTENGKIRFGFTAIKNMGAATIDTIIQNQPYDTIFDLVYKAHLSKDVLEALAQSGCLPWASRKAIINFIPTLISTTQTVKRDEMTLFGTGEELLPELADCPEYPIEQIMSFEKELLSFYISGHPLDVYDFPKIQTISEAIKGEVIIGGILTNIKTGVKNGKAWALATIEDYSGEIPVLIFGYKYNLEIGTAYLFKGTINDDPEDRKMFARDIKYMSKKTA